MDVSVEAKNYGQKLKKDFIPMDPNKTGGIPNLSLIHKMCIRDRDL